MKTIFKVSNRRSAVLLAATIALGDAANAAIQVQLNGQPLKTSVPPVRMGGRTVVPMRDIFEALGAEVTWNSVTQGITAQQGAIVVNLAINNRKAAINGRQVMLDQPATLWRGKTMVPLRFVSEAMGAQVSWNDAMQLVSIETAGMVRIGENPVTPPVVAPPVVTPPVVTPPVVAPPAAPKVLGIPGGVVVPVTLDRTVSSATARVGEAVTASLVSQRLGDSEFPPGSKLEGVVLETKPRNGQNPGVLDMDFRSVLLPGGERVPVRTELIALDNDSVVSDRGRIVARTTKQSGSDRLKIVGIGAGIGFVLGKVLDKNSTITAVLGAAGGYLYSRQQDKNRSADAAVAQNTRLGLRILDSLNVPDTANYAGERANFLKANANSPVLGVPLPVAAVPGNVPVAPGSTGLVGGQPIDLGGIRPPVSNPQPQPQPATLRSIAVPANAVVPVSMNQNISSATARVGDAFSATVVSERVGDAEFPPGTRLEGVVVEATPKNGDHPGVLDLEFRSALLPNGSRWTISGQVVSLDDKDLQQTSGRIIAPATKGKSTGDRLKIVGIGAGIGFVLGKVLHKNSTVTALLGAVGGFLLSNKGAKAAEAVVAKGSRLGVLLDDNVSYSVPTDYYQQRQQYLQTPYRETVRAVAVPANVVVPVVLDQDISSATARAGDAFTATVISERVGDAEFPPGTRLEGVVVEATPKNGDQPGVLDLDFRSALLTNGSRWPIRGEVVSLEDKDLQQTRGRIIAPVKKGKSTGDRLKIVGIGAGIGFVLGKVLHKNTTVTSILGAVGGFLIGNKGTKASEAVIAKGSRLGVRLDGKVNYSAPSDYSRYRQQYLQN